MADPRYIYTANAKGDSLADINVYSAGDLTEADWDGRSVIEMYLRVEGSNKMISIVDLLTETAGGTLGSRPGKEIWEKGGTLDATSIRPDVFTANTNQADLVDLINNKPLAEDKRIALSYKGKSYRVEPRIYKLTKNTGVDKTKQYYKYTKKVLLPGGGFEDQIGYLPKEQITPPAYKELDLADQNTTVNDCKTNGTEAFVDMIKYRDMAGEYHYIQNAKVKYVQNPTTLELEPVITCMDGSVIDASNMYQEKHIDSTTDIEIQNYYTIDNNNFTAQAVYYTTSNTGASVTQTARLEVKHAGDVIEKLAIKSSSANTAPPDIEIRGDHFIVNSQTIPIKGCKYVVSGNQMSLSMTFQNVDQIIFDNNGNPIGYDMGSTTIDFSSLPFNISLSHTVINKTSDPSLYNATRVFENGSQNATFIQTAEASANGELKGYDFAEKIKAKDDFDRYNQELQDLLKNGLASKDDVDRVTELKNKLDKCIDTLKKYTVTEQVEVNGTMVTREKLATIDDLIKQYQSGQFFQTFFYDTTGEKIYINAEELTTLTSLNPYDWANSKTIGSILGKDKVTFDSKHCKAIIKANEKSKSAGQWAAAIGNGAFALMGATIAGPGMLFAPLLMGVGLTSYAVSGTIFAVEKIGRVIRQAKLNGMTVDDLKRAQEKEIKAEMHKEFEKHLKVYKEKLKLIDINFTSVADRDQQIALAQEQFKKARKNTMSKYMLLADTVINTKFNMKTKDIKAENLAGFLALKKRRQELLHGEELDYDTLQKISDAETQYNQDVNTAKNTITDKKLLRKRLANLKVERDNIINNFKTQSGPINSRLRHLRQTKQYITATNADKKQMEADLKKKFKEDLKNISIEEVSIKGMSDHEIAEFKKEIMEAAFDPNASPMMTVKNGAKFDDSADLEALLNGTNNWNDIHDINESVDAEQIEIGGHTDPNNPQEYDQYIKLQKDCENALDPNNPLTVEEVNDNNLSKEAEVKARLEAVLNGDTVLAGKVFDDKAIWETAGTTRSFKDLDNFVIDLQGLATIDERKNEITKRYDKSLKPKVQDLVNQLKTNSGQDPDIDYMLRDEALKQMADNLKNTDIPGASYRYMSPSVVDASYQNLAYKLEHLANMKNATQRKADLKALYDTTAYAINIESLNNNFVTRIRALIQQGFPPENDVRQMLADVKTAKTLEEKERRIVRLDARLQVDEQLAQQQQQTP